MQKFAHSSFWAVEGMHVCCIQFSSLCVKKCVFLRASASFTGPRRSSNSFFSFFCRNYVSFNRETKVNALYGQFIQAKVTKNSGKEPQAW